MVPGSVEMNESFLVSHPSSSRVVCKSTTEMHAQVDADRRQFFRDTQQAQCQSPDPVPKGQHSEKCTFIGLRFLAL